MIIEVAFGLTTVVAVAVLFWQAWRTMPQATTAEPLVAAPAVPPHDVLVDYARELKFTALTAEGAAEHHLEKTEVQRSVDARGSRRIWRPWSLCSL